MTLQTAMPTRTFKDRLNLALQAQEKRIDDIRLEVGIKPKEWDAIRSSENPPSLRVTRLIANALDVPTTYLAYEGVNVQLPSFRKHSRVTRRREKKTTIDIEHTLFNYVELEDALEQPLDPFAPPVYEFDWSDVGEVERAAGRVREWLGIEDGDLQPDVHAKLDDRVRLLPFDAPTGDPRERIDGCVVFSDRGGANIAFNASAPIDRQRFTLAHELGHLIMGADPYADDEKAANRFASAFLMPAEQLDDECSGLVAHGLLGMLRLKERFGCSVAAINMRCRDLGMVSESQYKRNWMEISYRGWRKREPEVRLNEPIYDRYPSLCLEAFEAGLITRSRLAELLGLPGIDYIDWEVP